MSNKSVRIELPPRVKDEMKMTMNHQGRYRSNSHFIQEAIEEKIKREKPPNGHELPEELIKVYSSVL